MYKISVPLLTENICRSDINRILNELKRFDAERVILAINPFETEEKRQRELADLKKYCKLFKEKGYEVAAWHWAFWYSGAEKFTRMTSVSGKESKLPLMCPSDPEYRRFAADNLKRIAQTGVDMILLDDDFRYTQISDGVCCACENHMKDLSLAMGEPITHGLLERKLLCGGANPYRDEWLKLNGHYMEIFAREMREAVDSVRPEVRLGRCACMSAWDIDGTDPIRIGRLLAGNTKPFLRLIGAPYWAEKRSWGNRIQDVIELERLERSWTDAEDFEIVAEGDTYPRPRTACPAAYVEALDTAMRADGRLDGIMKYGLDYCSSDRYETGYADRHVKNKPIYKAIEESFTGEAVGVRVYEAMKKYAHIEIPRRIEGTHKIEDYIFSTAARMLAANAIPSVYEGRGICGIAFGENARHLPDEALAGGLILDATAARILTEKGIDVGLRELGEEISAGQEYHIEENEYTNIVKSVAYRAKLDERVRVDSEFYFGNEPNIPASYSYENADGRRFFVFLFDTHYAPEYIWRTYMRGIQLEKAVKFLSGKALPAVCHKNPDLYMLCKRDGNKLSVGLWNFSIDEILEPILTLEREYKSIKFINCSGELDGNTVRLSELAPFGFAAVCAE